MCLSLPALSSRRCCTQPTKDFKPRAVFQCNTVLNTTRLGLITLFQQPLRLGPACTSDNIHQYFYVHSEVCDPGPVPLEGPALGHYKRAHATSSWESAENVTTQARVRPHLLATGNATFMGMERALALPKFVCLSMLQVTCTEGGKWQLHLQAQGAWAHTRAVIVTVMQVKCRMRRRWTPWPVPRMAPAAAGPPAPWSEGACSPGSPRMRRWTARPAVEALATARALRGTSTATAFVRTQGGHVSRAGKSFVWASSGRQYNTHISWSVHTLFRPSMYGRRNRTMLPREYALASSSKAAVLT